MADPRYKNIGSPAIRIIEECGEMIQAVCKGERFGWDSRHPDRPMQTNLEDLEKEMADVVEAYGDLKKSLTSQSSGETEDCSHTWGHPVLKCKACGKIIDYPCR